MGRRARACWAAAALGCTGLLCAVLGAVMIVAVPSIIKQQVHKVGAGPGRGLEGLGAGGAGGAAAHLHGPAPTRLRLEAEGGP